MCHHSQHSRCRVTRHDRDWYRGQGRHPQSNRPRNLSFRDFNAGTSGCRVQDTPGVIFNSWGVAKQGKGEIPHNGGFDLLG